MSKERCEFLQIFYSNCGGLDMHMCNKYGKQCSSCPETCNANLITVTDEQLEKEKNNKLNLGDQLFFGPVFDRSCREAFPDLYQAEGLEERIQMLEEKVKVLERKTSGIILVDGVDSIFGVKNGD